MKKAAIDQNLCNIQDKKSTHHHERVKLNKYCHHRNIKVICWNVAGGLNERCQIHHQILAYMQRIDDLHVVMAQETAGLKGGFRVIWFLKIS